MSSTTTRMPNQWSNIANLIAGLSVAGLLIPEAIAYAGIAGITPEHALVASVVGLLAYACIGGSRYAIVTPTSSSAAILAASVASLLASTLDASIPGTPAAVHNGLVLSTALVLLVGLLFMIAALARVGHLAAFISRPVLRGFAFGLAITIVVKQLPHIAGLVSHASGPVQILLDLGQHVADWNFWAIGIGCAAYLSLRLLKRIPMFPAAFAVMLLGIGATWLFNLPAHGVALVGDINLANLHFDVPTLTRDEWFNVGELAFPLVVILYAESWGSMRTLALLHNDPVNPDRELAALGAANLLSGLLQGLPVGAGFSASSANEEAGASGKMAGVVAAFTIVVLILAIEPWLARLPEPVLAAIVISALTHALDPRPLVALWRLGRDEILAACAVIAVIGLGLLHGMLLAVLLSILAAVRRFSQARVAVLGELGPGRDYVDIAKHPDAITPARVLVVRPEEPLFFANAERALAQVRILAEQRADASVLIISLEESIDLDSTAVEVIAEFSAWVTRSQRHLLLARVKDDVRELLQRQTASSPTTPCFRSVADAVHAACEIVSKADEPVAKPSPG